MEVITWALGIAFLISISLNGWIVNKLVAIGNLIVGIETKQSGMFNDMQTMKHDYNKLSGQVTDIRVSIAKIAPDND